VGGDRPFASNKPARRSSDRRPPGYQRDHSCLAIWLPLAGLSRLLGPSDNRVQSLPRWSARGIWQRLFEALVQSTDRDIHLIDSTTAKAHRSAAGGKGGQVPRRSAAQEAADRQKSMLLSIVAAVQSRCE